MGRKAGKMCKSRLFSSISSSPPCLALPDQVGPRVVFLPFHSSHLPTWYLHLLLLQRKLRLFKLRDRVALAGQPAAEWPLASHQAKARKAIFASVVFPETEAEGKRARPAAQRCVKCRADAA